jgi:hypothetical protein
MRGEKEKYGGFVLRMVPKRNHESMMQPIRRNIGIFAKENLRLDCFGGGQALRTVPDLPT